MVEEMREGGAGEGLIMGWRAIAGDWARIRGMEQEVGNERKNP